MDMTYPVVFLILLIYALAGGALTYVWYKWVKPWLQSKNLETEAGIVVKAVEALLGRHTGEEKWRLALEKMQALGWSIDADIVIDALKAAWTQLDLAQIAAGVKTLEETPPVKE